MTGSGGNLDSGGESFCMTETDEMSFGMTVDDFVLNLPDPINYVANPLISQPLLYWPLLSLPSSHWNFLTKS